MLRSHWEIGNKLMRLLHKNPGFEHEVLYVFCPQTELAYGEAVEAVDIYSKFNIIGNERVVV